MLFRSLYIERWLKAPIKMPDGTIRKRLSGIPQGSVISPILANLFMHYGFDRWMETSNPENPWARYADDGIVHCRTKEEAIHVLKKLTERLEECKLEIHSGKTAIIYCKDVNRKEKHENTSFDFLKIYLQNKGFQKKKWSLFCLFQSGSK